MRLTPADLVPAIEQCALPPSMKDALLFTLRSKKKHTRIKSLAMQVAGINTDDLPSEKWNGPLPEKGAAEDAVARAIQRLQADYTHGHPYSMIALRNLAWQCSVLTRVLEMEIASAPNVPQKPLAFYTTMYPEVAHVHGPENPIESPTARNALAGDLMIYLNNKEPKQ
jgi:hypothetical protein